MLLKLIVVYLLAAVASVLLQRQRLRREMVLCGVTRGSPEAWAMGLTSAFAWPARIFTRLHESSEHEAATEAAQGGDVAVNGTIAAVIPEPKEQHHSSEANTTSK